MDFTIESYFKLLCAFINKAKVFKCCADYFQSIENREFICLRHDVDLLPDHSLRFAKIQAEHGIKGTYYFRAVPQSWDEKIITRIHDLGHEVGYHYETMDTAFRELKKNRKHMDFKPESKNYEDLVDLAHEQFVFHLDRMRKLVPVQTICMHGSPRSPFDNKAIWEKYNYRDLGILGEPYFDVDFDKVFYLTDTGRRWDGYKVSVRDKVPQQVEWEQKGLVFRSTGDIIAAIEQDRFPDKAMLTFHPQRWHDKTLPWVKEWAVQSGKNMVKRALISWRS